MALWKLFETTPISYYTCEEKPCTTNYGNPPSKVFCAGANLHSERLSINWAGSGHFFYMPSQDRLILKYILDACWTTAMLGIPVSTYQTMFAINPQTGALDAAFQDWAYMLGGLIQRDVKGIEPGSYGKFYTTSSVFSSGMVFEIDFTTMRPVENGWYKLYADLPEFATLFPGAWVAAPQHSIVNREDGILMINGYNSRELHFWNIASTPHVYLGKMTAPGVVSDVSYEDRYRLWVITKNGYLQKINYHLLRTELLTELPDKEATDHNYLVAWDQKRFRVVVFRHKADASNGACTSTVEFYRPLPKVELLTDPVPIRPLRWGKHIPFSFHLVGTAGEGISPYMVQASLIPPAEGYLERASMGTGQYGIGGAEYVAPAQSCQETLHLEANIEDGSDIEETEWLAPRYGG